MRKLSSLALAAAFAVTAFATPASAQQMQASGSCGSSAGNYGLHDVNSSMESTETQSVPALFYTVNYSGVPAPTTVGVIVRQNGEVESQLAVVSFTAQNAGGTFEGALRANISPEAQGFANSIDADRRGRNDGPPDGGQSASQRTVGGPSSSGTQGSLTPGDYVFYIYTGSVGDVFNVKDGTVSRNAFIADEKGFLGSFSCGVSTQNGSGPG